VRDKDILGVKRLTKLLREIHYGLFSTENKMAHETFPKSFFV